MAYFPNGSAGEHLENQCGACLHGRDDDIGCPIAHVQMEYNYSQGGNEDLEAAITIMINEKGDCQMKPLIDKFYKAKEKPVDNTHRSLFEVKP